MFQLILFTFIWYLTVFNTPITKFFDHLLINYNLILIFHFCYLLIMIYFLNLILRFWNQFPCSNFLFEVFVILRIIKISIFNLNLYQFLIFNHLLVLFIIL